VHFGETVKDSGRPVGDGSQKSPIPIFQERHYTVAEIAEILQLSRDVIRKLFEREPGVLVIGGDETRSKRGYHTLRIPESVAVRVYRRLRIPDLTPVRPRAYPSNKSEPPSC
jgi:hypothetical protein